MAFPLATVLSAAPGIISAAADIIKLIRNRKPVQSSLPPSEPLASDPRIEELAGLIEKQALVIEELARNNSNLALAVRNNRILSVVSIGIAIVAVGIAFLV